MKILAIDTSCDETAAAVTCGTAVLSNVIWSQAASHAEFGGVMPSLAQRMHKERIDWVINKAVLRAQGSFQDIGAIAVTQGPGLAIALEVGIAKAKELATKLNIPLIPVNHVEGHLLSALAKSYHPSNSPLNLRGENQLKEVDFPALGLVVSGGHTELVMIEGIGRYKILAKTQDDALGEALDKAARMLGLGYPGGAILEKMARLGNPKAYLLPMPMARSADKQAFSYSGLKTAFWRMTDGKEFNKQEIYDLAASFQNRAFQHLERVIRQTVLNSPLPLFNQRGGPERELLVGGGVVANIELRNRLRRMGKELGLAVRFPYSKKLIGDNAAMIGIAAGLRYTTHNSLLTAHFEQIDRKPRWSVEEIV
jgi:N6-L-threonylcarbamoyladenine synthase